MAGKVKKRIVVGVSGASGAVLAFDMLTALRAAPDVETHLVMTPAAEQTLSLETGRSSRELAALADIMYDIADMGAAISSGSFRTDGMTVIPCSMKTVAGIACGYSDNLLLRAADVTLKERRALVLVVREAPFSTIHLRNMLELSQMGAVILPAVMSFYGGITSAEDMRRQLVGKALDQIGIGNAFLRRWGEPS